MAATRLPSSGGEGEARPGCEGLSGGRSSRPMDRQRPPGSSSVICGRADGSGPPRLARAVPRTSGPVVAAREEAVALWER